MGDLFNSGVVGKSGSEWKKQRTAVAPAFSMDNIKGLVPTFVEHSKDLLSILGDRQLNVDLRPWFAKLTLDILGDATFGYQFDVLKDKEGIYQTAFSTLTTIKFPILETVFPFLAKLPTPAYRKKQELSGLVHELNAQMIEGKKKEMAELLIERRKDLLDSLIFSSELDNEELHGNMWTFFVAGHETTATALSWGITFLAKYPEHQTKIYEELRTVVGDRDPTYEDIKNLAYLEMFVKEVLRICPPVTFLTGRTTKETKEIDGLVIPAGTRISPFIYAIHHSPEFWPEPEKFDPTRFSPEKSQGRHPYSFLPFSLGRRHCIGNLFSLLEQKIILVMLIRKYHIKYICEPEINCSDIIFKPSSVHVGLESRL